MELVEVKVCNELSLGSSVNGHLIPLLSFARHFQVLLRWTESGFNWQFL